MLRKTIIAVILADFLLVSSLASASQMSQSQPEFLKDTGAVALTSDEMGEVRGESWSFIAKSAYALLDAAVKVSDLFGWQLGRYIAISGGLPDPGSNPDPQGLIGWVAKVF